jgi:hypothetical protein
VLIPASFTQIGYGDEERRSEPVVESDHHGEVAAPSGIQGNAARRLDQRVYPAATDTQSTIVLRETTFSAAFTGANVKNRSKAINGRGGRLDEFNCAAIAPAADPAGMEHLARLQM